MAWWRECWKLCSCPLKQARTPPASNSPISSSIPSVFRCCGPAQNGGWWQNGMRQRIRSAGSTGNALRTNSRCFGIAEQPPALEEMFLGRIDAHELDVRGDPEAIEQTGADRRPAGRLFAGEPGREIEVVHDLPAVVALLGLAGVMVADRRAHRHTVDRIAVRLEEREEPVVVFRAGILGPQQEPLRGVDVVAGGQDQPDVLGVDGALQREPDFALPLGRRRRPADAGAEVADDGERERTRRAAWSDRAGCETRWCSCRRSAPAPASPDPSPSGGPRPTPRASRGRCRCTACPAADPKSGSGCTRWSSRRRPESRSRRGLPLPPGRTASTGSRWNRTAADAPTAGRRRRPASRSPRLCVRK